MNRQGQKLPIAGLALIFLFSAYTYTYAHHSFAMYDMTATRR